jgi:hypothetical protein
MAVKIGLDAKAYYGTSGSTATEELTNIRDATLNLETGEADITTRASNGWRSTKATLKDGTIEFEMVWDDADAGFTAIKDAYFNNTLIALLFLDQEGGQGINADFTITNFSKSEPLEEAQTVSVTAKPSYDTRAPAWYEGA